MLQQHYEGDRANKPRASTFLGCGVGVGLILFLVLSTRSETRSGTLMSARNIGSYFQQKLIRRTLREIAGGRRTESSVPVNLQWSSDISYDWKTAGSDRDITVLQGSFNRPVEGTSVKVYTWYVERPKNIKERDEELIASWKAVWRAYGFDPYVLGLEDAQSNPDFLDFNQSLDAVLNPEYSRDAARRPCFLRYLAMAMQARGGMMVDLDTTPANIAATQQMDSNTKFTLFCQVDSPPPLGTQDWVRGMEQQSGLPCAAVGTAAEWMRAGKLAVWTMQYTTAFGGHSWTDMQSLGRLSTWNEIDLVKEQRVRSPKPLSWDTCNFRLE